MNVEQAVEAHERHPHLFGGCVLALRALAQAGRREEAERLAKRYASSNGGGPTEGLAFLTLLGRAQVLDLSAGEEIVAEGGRDGDAVYVVLEGAARARRQGVGVLGELSPGSVIGEVAAMEGIARTATVWATEPSRVLVLSTDDLERLQEVLPDVRHQLHATARTRLVRQLMGEQTIFSDLSADQRAALYEECIPATLPEGMRVIREGMPGNAVCIIASGTAEVWRRGAGGQREVLARLGPGEVFGELAILFDTVASATVEALTPLTVFAFSKERFEAALRQHPEARKRVQLLARMRLKDHDRDREDLPAVSVVRTPT